MFRGSRREKVISRSHSVLHGRRETVQVPAEPIFRAQPMQKFVAGTRSIAISQNGYFQAENLTIARSNCNV